MKKIFLLLIVGLLFISATAFALNVGYSKSNPGASCYSILSNGYSLGDGFYYIDPDGLGGETAITTYCDMTTNGGGWTKVNGMYEATINILMKGSAEQISAHQMLKCSDGDPASIISPEILLEWSWSVKKKVGGIWVVNGSDQSCGTEAEFDYVTYGWGFGCSNGENTVNKLYPGVCSSPSWPTGCGSSAAHTQSSFSVCGPRNYGSYSIFVRETIP